MKQDFATLEASGWTRVADPPALKKQFKFRDFDTAFRWMTAIAAAAEALNHHPDWQNSYNRVDVSLTTHSKKALTKLDIQLAQAMDDQFDQMRNGGSDGRPQLTAGW